MTTYRIASRLTIAAALAVALGATACSENTAPGTPALSRAQADSLGQSLVADVEAELDVATASGATAYVPGAAPQGPALAPPPDCVSITPFPPVNTDGDRVPDSVRLAFNVCVVTYPRGSDTVRGLIDIIDPTPSLADHSLKQVFTDLTRIHVGLLDRESSVTQNGTRLVARDTTQLSQSEIDFRTDFAFASGATATHTRTWTVTFTADVVGSIQPDAALPSGSLSVQGTSTWTRGDRTYSLQVSTPTPLHYDASCTVRPRFDAGTFVAIVTRNGATSTVTIQFTACGQYTVTRS